MAKRDIKSKRIIILGASGFIGSYLFRSFSKDKRFSTLVFSSKDLNLLSEKAVKKSLSTLTRKDVLIMASSISRIKENSYSSMLKNIKMAENVAGAIRNRPAGLIIYFSTTDIYGMNIGEDVKISENLIPNPNDYYSISKLASEYILKNECLSSNVPITVLRLPGVYGPQDAGRSTIGNLINSALKGKKVYVNGSGGCVRDYVYVNDISKIVESAIKNRVNATLNVATGKSYTIKNIIGIIGSYLDHKVRIYRRPLLSRACGAKRIKKMVFDCSYFRSFFPYLKLKNIEEGIPLYISELACQNQLNH